MKIYLALYNVSPRSKKMLMSFRILMLLFMFTGLNIMAGKPTICCVDGCREAKPEVINPFPKNPIIKKLWLSSCGLEEEETPDESQGVCNVHFSPSDFLNGSLIPGAIPDTTGLAQTSQFLEKLDVKTTFLHG